MDLAVPREIVAGERRVALIPESAARLVAAGHRVLVQAGAGEGAYADDSAYAAGVAGLQAIATARRLGAVVQAFDTRPAAGEQVESLGARFLTLPVQEEHAADPSGYARALSTETARRERDLLREPVAAADVIIT